LSAHTSNDDKPDLIVRDDEKARRRLSPLPENKDHWNSTPISASVTLANDMRVHLARLVLPLCGIIINRVRERNARAGRPTQRTWTWRSRHGPGFVCGGLHLGGHRGQIGARPRGLLAGRDAALLRT